MFHFLEIVEIHWKYQLYDLQRGVSLGFLCVLKHPGARLIQLYDLLIAFRLSGACKNEQIV